MCLPPQQIPVLISFGIYFQGSLEYMPANRNLFLFPSIFYTNGSILHKLFYGILLSSKYPGDLPKPAREVLPLVWGVFFWNMRVDVVVESSVISFFYSLIFHCFHYCNLTSLLLICVLFPLYYTCVYYIVFLLQKYSGE